MGAAHGKYEMPKLVFGTEDKIHWLFWNLIGRLRLASTTAVYVLGVCTRRDLYLEILGMASGSLESSDEMGKVDS